MRNLAGSLGYKTLSARALDGNLVGCSPGQLVVLKQFNFASGTWSALQELNHPRIPRYLDFFEEGKTYYLVQTHVNAKPIQTAFRRKCFSKKAVFDIIRQLLDVLCYLQSLIPPVFHRDIKPENILLDEQKQVYLVDFGFARFGGRNLAFSSIAFMPPEQLRGLELSCASDLYSLGMTLVCLLEDIDSYQIGELVNFYNKPR